MDTLVTISSEFENNNAIPGIDDFLSISETEHLIKLAEETGLKNSETANKGATRRSNTIDIKDVNMDKHLSVDEVSKTGLFEVCEWSQLKPF